MTAEPLATLPPSTFQALSPDDPRVIAGYHLYARLGMGGMGCVYLAYTPGGRPVALKVIRPELAADHEFRRRFAREVASARRIHSLYTAQVVDAGTDSTTPWLATAFVPGPSLHQLVLRHGPLPERTVLLLLAGIAEALQAIHSAGVVHRDLKPGNVLVAADGPRVIDFGIARAADATPLTSTGVSMGSPGFMAPEQLLGLPATPATDVFALGALIAHAGSGTLPFGAGPDHASLYRAVHGEPDLSQLPHGLHELVRLCLAKAPENRPGTAWLIEAARNHPATGGELRFSDGWLPQQVSSELRRHTDLPRTHVPPDVVLDPALPAPVPAGAHPPLTGSPAAATPRRGIHTALLTIIALFAGAAATLVALGFFYSDDSGDQNTAAGSPPVPATSTLSRPSASAPTTTAKYTAIYSNLELTSPDPDYDFDLKAGKVAQDTSTWYLGRQAREFYTPEGSDAYIPPTDPLTLAACIKGIDIQPAPALPFTDLPAERNFCISAAGGADIALIRMLNAASDDGPIKVSITYYHRTA